MSEPEARMVAPAQAWSAAERESFFAAITRHRAMAWRVDLASRACALVLAFVVAILLSPLLYALLALVLDLVNFVWPMPHLLEIVFATLEVAVDAPESVPLTRWLYLASLAALPGLILMAGVTIGLGRMVRELSQDPAAVAARAPRPEVLAEQRFANTVAEMALAANLPAPRVLVSDAPEANAAAFGPDEAHASIVVSAGLLGRLDRAEMQGVAAHLVGSIANGDMGIGVRLAATLSLFGLIARLGEAFGDERSWKRFFGLLREVMRPGSAGHDRLLMELADPFTPAGEQTPGEKAPEQPAWRKALWVPVAGPVVIGGFFGGLTASSVLAPLLSLVWRRRKYLADATAVRLTRDPDTLAEALAKLGAAPSDGAFTPWMAHMTIVHRSSHSRSSVLSTSAVPMFPALERRLAALGRLGSTVSWTGRRTAWWARPIMLPVSALIAVLMSVVIVLLAGLSVMLSMLMTCLPAMLLSTGLRALAG